MFKNSELVNYMACELCFSQTVKPDKLYCKKCQVKARYNKTSNRKLHNITLKRNSGDCAGVLNLAKRYIESNYSSSNLNGNSSLSIIQYTHKVDSIHIYEWSNFQKVEHFGDLVIKSKKFPIIEYIFRWGNDLQNIPRIQSFMKEHENESNKIGSRPKSCADSVVARPLLLLLQETFWMGLIESYIKYFHPLCTLFSLTNFNPKTVSKSLLSAIYFAGSVTQYNLPVEVKSYMHVYATINIKKILFMVNISSAQALGIYSYAHYIDGNSSLSRVCLSHFARMNHALGISVNRKKLSVLDQYNRKLIDNNMRLYYIWSKLGPSSYNVASEDDKYDSEIYEPSFQYPNPNLNLCNNEYESTLYSVFCTQFAKITNFNLNNISKFCKFNSKKLRIEIVQLKSKADEIYKDAKLALESVVNLAPEYKSLTSIYLDLVEAIYLLCILSIHSKTLEISKKRNLDTIQYILDNSIELWKVISGNTIFMDKWSWTPYVVGFHLIQIHPNCTKKQKKSVIFILKSIFNLLNKEGYKSNSIHYTILKTQFNLIHNN